MTAPRPSPRPATDVPLRYLCLAAAALVAAALGVVWRAGDLAGHYYHPHVVALAHTVTLGWITLAIMGASYQVLPVVLERPVWSERLARWQFWILLVGVTGMVAHFWLGTWPGLVGAAALVAVGVGLHLVNVLAGARGLARVTFTVWLVGFGYAGLALTTVFGLLLGISHLVGFAPARFFPTLHAHVHLALLGWVMPMVLGVTARVYPMFLLAPEPGGWPERAQFWGLAAGVPAVVGGLLLGSPVAVGVGAVAVAVAIAGHLAWVWQGVRTSRRPGLDWGLRLALTGAAFLLPAALLGLAFAFDALAGPRFGLAYAVLALGGWVSLTIAGMLLKIVPFLVWYRVYSARAGREPVPALGALSWARAEAVACVLLTAGVAGLAVAVAAGSASAIRAAGAVLALGALALAAALAGVLSHLLARGRSLGAAKPGAPGGATAAGPSQSKTARRTTGPVDRPITPAASGDPAATADPGATGHPRATPPATARPAAGSVATGQPATVGPAVCAGQPAAAGDRADTEPLAVAECVAGAVRSIDPLAWAAVSRPPDAREWLAAASAGSARPRSNELPGSERRQP